jgi:hypothetical protein
MTEDKSISVISQFRPLFNVHDLPKILNILETDLKWSMGRKVMPPSDIIAIR